MSASKSVNLLYRIVTEDVINRRRGQTSRFEGPLETTGDPRRSLMETPYPPDSG